VRRIRRVDSDVDAERLRNPDPDLWLEPAERVAIVEMVDQACAAWVEDPDADTALDRLAPAARFPARLIADREEAIRLTEKLVVSYRRSLAGYKYAMAQHRPGAEVAAEFALGHVSRPDEDERWLASGALHVVI
jgi:hypothetical protein